MIKIGLCGLGFMGKMHAACYAAIPDVKIAAVADVQLAMGKALADKHGAKTFDTAKELIARADVDVLDICLPTYMHCEHVLLAAKRGLNCLCEKPMALDVGEANRMVKAVRAAEIKFMVGQVIRFWPEYQVLKEYVDRKKLGPLASLVLRRFVAMPEGWRKWFQNASLSRGAALDLHIHDSDYVLYLFGKPRGLDSVGVFRAGAWSQMTTNFHYPNVAISAEGGWWASSEPFEMSFHAVFKKGVLSYSSASLPLACYELNKEPSAVHVPQAVTGDVQAGGNISSLGGYYNEIKYFVDCLNANREPAVVTAETARDAIALVYQEMASARKKLKK